MRAAYPWVGAPDRGPGAVEAGECDRCRTAPRLLPTCGPVAWTALCRGCALELGTDAWCGGHADEAADLLAWARALPEEWPAVCRVWWIATGEVRLGDVDVSALRRLGPGVSGALGRGD